MTIGNFTDNMVDMGSCTVASGPSVAWESNTVRVVFRQLGGVGGCVGLGSAYMLPCLSEEEEELEGDGDGALGNTLSVGVMAGLPRPEELELLERCGPGPGP